MKRMGVVVACVVAIVGILAAPALSQGLDSGILTNCVRGLAEMQEGYYFSLGARKYINSFTSYQFPHPDTPVLDPLSRLEWPWEQTYGVARFGVSLGAVQVNIEGASTWIPFSGLKAQDSDWTDAGNPNQKTIFSEGKAKPRGWTLDVNFASSVPGVSNLQGVLGYRAQQFRFTYTDVWHRELYNPPPRFLPGAGIEFSEYYKHYYAGVVLSGALDLAALPNVSWLDTSWLDRLPAQQIFFSVQADVAYVLANNIDYHILRTPAPRFTQERTVGSSWHINLGIQIPVRDSVFLGIEGDMMRIRTRGSHNLTQPFAAQRIAPPVRSDS